MKVETSHTLNEYINRFGTAYQDGELWDFSTADVETNAIELDTEKVYWLIDSRYYETTLKC